MFYVYQIDNNYLYKCKSKKDVTDLKNIFGPGYDFYITKDEKEMELYLYKQTLKALNISLKNWTKRNIFDDYIYKLKQLHNLIT